MKYTFITEKQEEAFKRIFEDIDHDKNGRVTMTEIRHKMFANASKKDVNHLMQVGKKRKFILISVNYIHSKISRIVGYNCRLLEVQEWDHAMICDISGIRDEIFCL